MWHPIRGDLNKGITMIDNPSRGDIIFHKGLGYVLEDEKRYVPLDYESDFLGMVPKTFTIEEFEYKTWEWKSKYVWFTPNLYTYGKIKKTLDQNIFRVNAIYKDTKYVIYFNYENDDSIKLMKKFIKKPPSFPILAGLEKDHLEEIDGCVCQIMKDEEKGRAILYVMNNGSKGWNYVDDE